MERTHNHSAKSPKSFYWLNSCYFITYEHQKSVKILTQSPHCISDRSCVTPLWYKQRRKVKKSWRVFTDCRLKNMEHIFSSNFMSSRRVYLKWCHLWHYKLLVFESSPWWCLASFAPGQKSSHPQYIWERLSHWLRGREGVLENGSKRGSDVLILPAQCNLWFGSLKSLHEQKHEILRTGSWHFIFTAPTTKEFVLLWLKTLSEVAVQSQLMLTLSSTTDHPSKGLVRQRTVSDFQPSKGGLAGSESHLGAKTRLPPVHQYLNTHQNFREHFAATIK